MLLLLLQLNQCDAWQVAVATVAQGRNGVDAFAIFEAVNAIRATWHHLAPSGGDHLFNFEDHSSPSNFCVRLLKDAPNGAAANSVALC
jgi:hypothetical protein